MANNLKTLNKNVVVNFLENYGPNGCADICVMWLMRKHHLYFQPFSQDVVRWFLLAFCKRELSNKEVTKRMDLDSHDISSYQQLIDKLWCEYGLTDEYDDLWFSDVEEVQNVLRQLQTRHNSIEINRNIKIGNSWKRVYNKIFPSVIKAKGKIFQEQFDLEVIIKTLTDNLNELSNKQSKEQYIETIFKEYSYSLLNRILTLIDRQVIQEYSQVRADELAQDYSHTRPGGDGNAYNTVLTDEGLIWWRSGENIAKGGSNAREVFDSWISSEKHRAVILDPDMKYLSLAKSEGDGENYWELLMFNDCYVPVEGAE